MLTCEGMSTSCDSVQCCDSQNVGLGQVEPACVLAYSLDARLLETRAWVLELAGIKVRAAIELADVERILSNQTIDLFILCHTLTPEESYSVLARAHALQPSMINLVLTAGTPLGTLGSCEENMSVLEGPGAFIAKVGKMLHANIATNAHTHSSIRHEKRLNINFARHA